MPMLCIFVVETLHVQKSYFLVLFFLTKDLIAVPGTDILNLFFRTRVKPLCICEGGGVTHTLCLPEFINAK